MCSSDLSDETDTLLDTGGALAKAARFFDDGEPFIVHNVDIVSSVDLHAFYRAHLLSNAAATLAVSKRPTSRYLLFDDDWRLQGWTNEATGEQKPFGKALDIDKLHKYAFSGIHIIAPELLARLTEHTGKFSIIDFYLEHSGNMPIMCADMTGEVIIDVGKMATFDQANAFIESVGL